MPVPFSQLEEHLHGLIAPALQNAVSEWRRAERERIVAEIAELAVRGAPGVADTARQLDALDREPWGVEQVHLDPENGDSRARMEFFVRDPHLRARVRIKVLYDAREPDAGQIVGDE